MVVVYKKLVPRETEPQPCNCKNGMLGMRMFGKDTEEIVSVRVRDVVSSLHK